MEDNAFRYTRIWFGVWAGIHRLANGFSLMP